MKRENKNIMCVIIAVSIFVIGVVVIFLISLESSERGTSNTERYNQIQNDLIIINSFR